MTTRKKVTKTASSDNLSSTTLYVLDTNVLLHDSTSLFKFDEHDIFIPLITLEELDDHKTGSSEVARNARSFARSVNELIAAQPETNNGFLLPCTKSPNCGKLYFQSERLESSLISALPSTKADNKILEVVAALVDKYPNRSVVLVSKDINIRLKAKALGLKAEDYKSDNLLDDSDVLPKGYTALDDKFMKRYGKHLKSWTEGRDVFYMFKGKDLPVFPINEFVVLEDMTLRIDFSSEEQLVGRLALDYASPRHSVLGVTARNDEQNIAMNLLMDPDVDFVSLLGPAGTGKTLLAIAAALHQTLNKKQYSEIIVTRATIPLGEDIGFLPGTEEEKMSPWMGAFEDNLEYLQSISDERAKKFSLDEAKQKIKIKSMSFMRGRTFINKFLIIDEAQNLTPKQVKALMTRAGQGTKIICLGNLAQIDTPYLTEGSSGLTHAVKGCKDFPHAGHVILVKGERSRLADWANENL